MFKVVILIGKGFASEKSWEGLVSKSHGEAIIIRGKTGKEKISELDLSPLEDEGATNDETLFIVLAHGIGIFNKDKIHHIDQIDTSEFLQNLQRKVVGRRHPITVYLNSYYGGLSLKQVKEVGDEISLLTNTGSKYESRVHPNDQIFHSTIKQKLAGKRNQEVLFDIITSFPETFYYKKPLITPEREVEPIP